MATLLRLLLATAALLALAGPPEAIAARPGHARPVAPLALAGSVAKRVWGASPCHGQVTVSTRRSLAAGLDPGSDAWVTFATPSGPNDLAAPAATYGDCRIFLTTARWPTRASMVSDWDMLCMTMVHEYGHLLGRAHDTAARSVMAPVFTDYTSEPQACRRTRP